MTQIDVHTPDATAPTDSTDSAEAASMRQIIDQLAVFGDQYAALWLGAVHGGGRLAGVRPIDLCLTEQGRGVVYGQAVRLAEGASR